MKHYKDAHWMVVFTLLAGIIAASVFSTQAQSGRKAQQNEARPRVVNPNEKTQERDSSNKPLAVSTPVEVDENGVIKLDTFLVTIPVSVTDRYGKFVPFLVKRDFHIFEDSVEQDIESLESIEVPFHVALVLDTSQSTRFNLEDIQDAAVDFVNQLRPDDKVMVVSFDSRGRVESEFTSDRAQLRNAIFRTRTGGSTKLYEAVDLVLAERLKGIQGRKAIVLFTDGVDTSSKLASAQSTIELVEESDTLVYPIHYDTEEAVQGGIYTPGRTPPVNPFPVPGGRRRWPFTPLIEYLTPQWPQWPQGRTPPGTSRADYERGARYLHDMADASGGRLYEADTLSHVSQAFSLIAEELRHQYRL